jgi:hypothetical protein
LGEGDDGQEVGGEGGQGEVQLLCCFVGLLAISRYSLSRRSGSGGGQPMPARIERQNPRRRQAFPDLGAEHGKREARAASAMVGDK